MDLKAENQYLDLKDNKGIYGFTFKEDHIAIKILNGSTVGCDLYENSIATFVHAIEYAKKQGIRIVNCSFEGDYPHQIERIAMEAADNILFIITAGYHNEFAKEEIYSTCDDYKNAIVINLEDYRERLRQEINSSNMIDYIAKIGWIFNWDQNSDYAKMNMGLSLMVSGIAALIWRDQPALTVAEIRHLLLDNITLFKYIKAYPDLIDAYKAIYTSSQDKGNEEELIHSIKQPNIEASTGIHTRPYNKEKTNMMLVRLKENLDINRWCYRVINKKQNIAFRIKDYLKLIDVYVLEFKNEQMVEEKLKEIQEMYGVIYAEPNYKRMTIGRK